jgi:hypothetical protein
LIDAPRQSGLAKPTAGDNHPTTRPPVLILIDAPFSSRLSCYTNHLLNPEMSGAWLRTDVGDTRVQSTAA